MLVLWRRLLSISDHAHPISVCLQHHLCFQRHTLQAFDGSVISRLALASEPANTRCVGGLATFFRVRACHGARYLCEGRPKLLIETESGEMIFENKCLSSYSIVQIFTCEAFWCARCFDAPFPGRARRTVRSHASRDGGDWTLQYTELVFRRSTCIDQRQPQHGDSYDNQTVRSKKNHGTVGCLVS